MSIGKRRKVVNIRMYADVEKDTKYKRGTLITAQDLHNRSVTGIADPAPPPRAATSAVMAGLNVDPALRVGIETRQKDPIRYFTGKLWSHRKDGLLVFGNDTPWGSVFSVKIDNSSEELANTTLLPRTARKIVLEPDFSNDWLFKEEKSEDGNSLVRVFNEELWDNILATIDGKILARDQLYLDCPFEYDTPFKEEEMEKLSVDNHSTMMADLDAQYNYFVRGYENRLSKAPAAVLPCMYSFISERESDYVDADQSVYNKHISLMSRIAGVYKDITNDKGKRIGERDTGYDDYFQTWGKAFRRINRIPSNYNELKERYKNAIFSQVDVDFLKGYSSKKHAFPMYMDLRFSTNPRTELVEALKETELGPDLINYILNSSLQGRTRLVGTKETIVNDRFEMQAVNTRSRFWDFTRWWATIGEERKIGNNIVFGRNKSNETSLFDGCRPQISNLLKVVLAARMREMARKHDRSLEEIFEEGKSAYSETLFYRIDKYRKNKPRTIMQSFFVPNSDELDICNFIDTQVKYGVAYKYRVTAYRLVFGTAYRYEKTSSGTRRRIYLDPNAQTQDHYGYATFPEYRIIKEPYLKLVRAPYYETAFERIIDKPPVAPDVNILPYKDIDNRLLFNLNANVGNYMLVPEIIEPGEEELIAQMEKKQKVSSGEPINYVSDDPPKFFEIYRLNDRPSNYREFAGNKLATITTKYGRRTLSAASFVDHIRPNNKYYYVFRTKDVHNNLSYPSPVYEVEMVNADGAVYLVIDIVSLEKESTKVPAKIMNKNIRIAPSFIHRVIDKEQTIASASRRPVAHWASVIGIDLAPEAPGVSIQSAKQIAESDIFLGKAEESIWDKKFKFRFISKSTGRKFDLNVKFNHAFDRDRSKGDNSGDN